MLSLLEAHVSNVDAGTFDELLERIATLRTLGKQAAEQASPATAAVLWALIWRAWSSMRLATETSGRVFSVNECRTRAADTNRLCAALETTEQRTECLRLLADVGLLLASCDFIERSREQTFEQTLPQLQAVVTVLASRPRLAGLVQHLKIDWHASIAAVDRFAPSLAGEIRSLGFEPIALASKLGSLIAKRNLYFAAALFEGNILALDAAIAANERLRAMVKSPETHWSLQAVTPDGPDVPLRAVIRTLLKNEDRLSPTDSLFGPGSVLLFLDFVPLLLEPRFWGTSYIVLLAEPLVFFGQERTEDVKKLAQENPGRLLRAIDRAWPNWNAMGELDLRGEQLERIRRQERWAPLIQELERQVSSAGVAFTVATILGLPEATTPFIQPAVSLVMQGLGLGGPVRQRDDR